MKNDAAPDRLTLFGVIIRVVIVGVVLLAVAAAGMVLYRMWLGGGVDRAGSNPNLSQTQRLYLEYYFSDHAAALALPAGSGSAPLPFTVAPGEGAAVIGENLRAAGLLNDTELFLNYLTYYGLDGGLVAGEYQLDPQATIPELAEALGTGRSRTLELSFLPGWRSEEMAAAPWPEAMVKITGSVPLPAGPSNSAACCDR